MIQRRFSRKAPVPPVSWGRARGRPQPPLPPFGFPIRQDQGSVWAPAWFAPLSRAGLSLSVNNEEEMPGACCKGQELLNHSCFLPNTHWCHNSKQWKLMMTYQNKSGWRGRECSSYGVCGFSAFRFSVHRYVGDAVHIQAPGTNTISM